MKIKLPEKRFYSLPELAERWESKVSDISHLIETGELKGALKGAALQGKRGVFYGFYEYEADPKRPCFIPVPSEQTKERWGKVSAPDVLEIHYPVPSEFTTTGVRWHEFYGFLRAPMPPYEIEFNDSEPAWLNKNLKEIEKWRQRDPAFFETVILLQDVLSFESKCLDNEQSTTCPKDAEKPLSPRAETTYQNIIAALLECIAGELPGVAKHPSFENESKLIALIDERFKGIGGLSASTLSRKFPEAKRSLAAS